ncbi:hypothetical protein BX616_002613, partial [Lobosporangium transversale]
DLNGTTVSIAAGTAVSDPVIPTTAASATTLAVTVVAATGSCLRDIRKPRYIIPSHIARYLYTPGGVDADTSSATNNP